MSCFMHIGILLVLFSLSHQQEFTPGRNPMFTDGESGELCGPRRIRCTTNATCIGGTECVCDHPTLSTGNGWMRCFPPDHFIAGVEGDPKVFTLDSVTAHIPYPCRHILTDVSTEHGAGTSGGICHYTIHGLNYFINNGFYILGVDLEITLVDNDDPENWRTVAIRVLGVESEDNVFQYEEYGKYGTVTKWTPWGDATSLNYLGINVMTVVDEENNFINIDVTECGLYISFRGFVRGSQQLPGIAIAIEDKPGLVFHDPELTLISDPFNFALPRLQQLSHDYNITRAEAALLIALNQDVKQDFGFGALTCSIAHKQFVHMCINEWWQAFALRTCSFLYLSNTTAACLDSDTSGHSLGTMFSFCIQSICGQGETLCNDVKYTLDCFDCVDLPDEFENFPCNDIQGAYAEYRAWMNA